VLLTDNLKQLALDVWYDKSLKARQTLVRKNRDVRIVIAICSANARTGCSRYSSTTVKSHRRSVRAKVSVF